jgi:outer membrane protein, multidrug efflux system
MATMRRRRVTLCLAAGLAAGCSLQPVYQRPEAPVSASYPQGPAYAPTAPAPTDSRAAADIGWREFLADARLQRLVETALANNRDLRVAALTVAQVQAQYRIQRAALLPRLDASASVTSTRTPADLSAGDRETVRHDHSAGLTAAWEIDFFGQLASQRDAALQQYLASAQARKAFEILLVSQVANQYLSLLYYDELLAVTGRTIEAAEASLRLTQLQLDAGTGTELALRQAQTVVERAQADHAAQVRGRAQAENGLVRLLGQPMPSDLPPAMPLNAQALLADIPAGLPSELLARRPDILQAEASLRGATANIGAARAAFFPSINLTGNLGTASSALSGLFKGGSLAWSFMPLVSVPIFEGGRLRAELDVATLQRDIDVARYEKAIQTAFGEVADNLAARGTYGRQLASIERVVMAEQRTLDLSQQRFRSGVDGYLSVLTAQNGLYAAQQTLAAVKLARLNNLVDLYRSLGGGWIANTGDVAAGPPG